MPRATPIDAGLYETPTQQAPVSALADPGAPVESSVNDGNQAPIADAVPPVVSAPKHSPWAVKQARDLGFSDDEIEGTAPTVLMRAIATARQPQADPGVTVGNAQPAAGRQAETPPPRPAIDWGTETVDGREVRITDDDIAPGIRNVIYALQSQIAQLQSQLANVNGHMASQTAATLAQRLDGVFSKYPQQFGVGGVESVAANYRTARQMVWRQVMAMSPQERAGRTPEQLVELTIQTVFGAQAAQPAAPQTEYDQPVQPTTTAVPTARHPGRTPPGDTRAAAQAANRAAAAQQQQQRPQARVDVDAPLTKHEFL